jgi:hypothetical protein
MWRPYDRPSACASSILINRVPEFDEADAIGGSRFGVDDDVGDRGELLSEFLLEFAGELVGLVQ